MMKQLEIFYSQMRELRERVGEISRALRLVGDEVFDHRAEIQRLRKEVEALKTHKR